jgi:predicted DNA binding CopG/RHH family protein
MKNYVKNKDEYNEIEVDEDAIKKAYDKLKKSAKHPTSINLPENVVVQLKDIAKKKSVPYQTLMRMLIVEGLERLKKSA